MIAQHPGGNAVNGLTVDLEDWYHTEAVRRRIAPADHMPRVEEGTDWLLHTFAAFGVQATFFVVGELARRHPALVRRIARAGHELGSHGYTHERTDRLGPAAFAAELGQTKAVLEDLAGQGIIGHRSPTWSIGPHDLWALDALAAQGFAYDASLHPSGTPIWGIAGLPCVPHRIRLRGGAELREFPASVAGRPVAFPFSGGIFLRSLPQPLVRRLIERRGDAGIPTLLYIHPWEVDPGIPTVHLPTVWRFVQYHGLAQVRARITDLLERFSFGSLRQMAAAWPWETAPLWNVPSPSPGPSDGHRAGSCAR